jgi:uncharacterized DUF497 family protein
LVDLSRGDFEWDDAKEQQNIVKHGVNFSSAARVFADPGRRIFMDSKHSAKEDRFFCIGQVADEIITVRFTYRQNKVRIIGAGIWRKGRAYYEKKQ